MWPSRDVQRGVEPGQQNSVEETSDGSDAGATEMVAPGEFPGGRFAIVSDPQGAMFRLLKTE